MKWALWLSVFGLAAAAWPERPAGAHDIRSEPRFVLADRAYQAIRGLPNVSQPARHLTAFYDGKGMTLVGTVQNEAEMERVASAVAQATGLPVTREIVSLQ